MIDLVTAVQARGSDAQDIRDAAHEACHALCWNVTKKWTRDNIHRARPRRRALGVVDEILARAVEQLVSARLGYDCGSVEKWATVCWMETYKNERILLPTGSWLEDRIRDCMKTDRAKSMVDAVIALTSGDLTK